MFERERQMFLRPGNRRSRLMQDEIIIGGGPVGFINALGLAQAGVRVTVIEAEPQIINSPRAAVYSWSVLDGLGRLGILEEAEAVGVRKQDYTYLVRRTGERLVYSMEILKGHTPYPCNLHLGQHLLAEIAMRRLKSFSNATVRVGTRLQSLHQDADGATLSVVTERGTQQLRARWVIGADGAGSTVGSCHQSNGWSRPDVWPIRQLCTVSRAERGRFGARR
jgi:2-polyprenyl-6-methoxyphenol hydroxylase-like FAD-dependent oxidoreductase